MGKSDLEHFRDWETFVFGFGYGDGEEPILGALKEFLKLCPADGTYDHAVLSAALTPRVTWLMINTLIRNDIIDYGTSPRFGWLTPQGRRLKDFCSAHTLDELIEATVQPDGYMYCAPGSCTCDRRSGVSGNPDCTNPFWGYRIKPKSFLGAS